MADGILIAFPGCGRMAHTVCGYYYIIGHPRPEWKYYCIQSSAVTLHCYKPSIHEAPGYNRKIMNWSPHLSEIFQRGPFAHITKPVVCITIDSRGWISGCRKSLQRLCRLLSLKSFCIPGCGQTAASCARAAKNKLQWGGPHPPTKTSNIFTGGIDSRGMGSCEPGFINSKVDEMPDRLQAVLDCLAG